MGKVRKPETAKLHELTAGQFADVFALLADKGRGSTRENKPFFACKFRDARRTATVMVWADSPQFEDCQANWQPGQFFKLRGTYSEHDKYGPQVELDQIRLVGDRDRADGFRELDFAERSREEPATLLADLTAFAAAEIRDDPLKEMVAGLLTAHADKLLALPASPRQFYPFPGGWLEHTLNVTRSTRPGWPTSTSERFPGPNAANQPRPGGRRGRPTRPRPGGRTRPGGVRQPA